jgi:hypothetical protein
MDADVADACDLPRGADFLISFFFAITKLKWFSATMPVCQERGNVPNGIKCATQIFKNFRKVKSRGRGCRSALILNNEPTHVGCYDENQLVCGKRLDMPVLRTQSQIREMQWPQICKSQVGA